MTVQEIIQAVQHRIPNFAKFGPVFTLETMNAVYKQLNEEHHAIEDEADLDFGSPASQGDGFIALPAAVNRVFRVSPERDWRLPSMFRNSEPNTFTIFNREFHVANTILSASETLDILFTIGFYSYGLTLVDDTSPSAGEANAPEWPEAFHRLLLYETCLEMTMEYPQAAYDLEKAKKLTYQLSNIHTFKVYGDQEEATEMGPHGRNADIIGDPYEATRQEFS